MKIWLRKGVQLLDEVPGDGAPVERLQYYLLASRISLNRGDVVLPQQGCVSHTMDEYLRVSEDGYLESRTRIDRENLIAGIFYAVQGMCIGGYRKVSIAPHLAYGEVGIEGIIPPQAKIIAEIKVLSALE